MMEKFSPEQKFHNSVLRVCVTGAFPGYSGTDLPIARETSKTKKV